MNKLIIKSLSIIDFKQEKANEFNFSSSANLIVSESNGEGKSSIVKSIYYCLGANLKAFPKEWDYKNYIFQLELLINDDKILVQRHNNIIKILDGKKIKNFKSFKDYSLWFQSKMNMDIELVNKSKNDTSLASIEAIFSPLYIDQDKSWDGKLFKESFEGLGRYKTQSFPKDVIDYYLGFSDKNIIDMEKEKNKCQEQLRGIKIKIDQVQSVYDEYSKQKNVSKAVPKEFSTLEKELNYYIQKADRFSKEITKEKEKLSKEKMNLDILKQDEKELEKLLSKTEERLSKVGYRCVYCHSKLTREQSLTRMELDDNKIAIELQRDIIIQKIKLSEDEVRNQMIEISNLENQFKLYYDRLSELEKISDINDYINQSVLLELNSLIIDKNDELGKLEVEIRSLEKEIKRLKKEFESNLEDTTKEYDILKNKISFQIAAEGISTKKIRNYYKLNGSGTNLNKDLLAIYLVYMNLIDNTKNFGLPFAIDSFVKNETDSKVLEKMFNAINDYFLTLNNQTFFSIIEENLKYIDTSINKIIVKKPLLESECYDVIVKKLVRD